jgi:hypothetical protein
MSATETPVVPAEEVTAPVPTQEEADIFPQPTSMDSEPESEAATSDNSASAEEAEDTSSDTSSQPEEMRQWIEKIDAIQYNFQADDYDENRSFNYFTDADGKTLKITEFYCGDTPFININGRSIIPRDALQAASCIFQNDDGSCRVDYDGDSFVINNVSADLLMEAMMVLGDDCGSDTEEEAEEEEQSPAEEEKPTMNASQQSVVNFLTTFFLLVIFIKAVGFITVTLNPRK